MREEFSVDLTRRRVASEREFRLKRQEKFWFCELIEGKRREHEEFEAEEWKRRVVDGISENGEESSNSKG